MPNTVTGTHTAAPGPASLPSPWQMWLQHDAGLRAVTSAAPAWPLAQPSSRGWKSPINNHYAVVTAPKESPREPLCGLPHRFSSPGMLGVGVGRCSALEAKGIHSACGRNGPSGALWGYFCHGWVCRHAMGSGLSRWLCCSSVRLTGWSVLPGPSLRSPSRC